MIKSFSISGIKCDNSNCDYRDDSVKSSDYDKWLNKPCPKCGTNLLTQEDYDHVKELLGKSNIFVELTNLFSLNKNNGLDENIDTDKESREHLVQIPYKSMSLSLKKNLVLASNNEGKKNELQKLLGDNFRVYSLNELNIDHETIEDQDSLKGNSLKKALEVKQLVPKDFLVLADDSGLFVDELNGEPGVKSARYALDHNDDANINKVLDKLKGETNRDATFSTILCLVDEYGNEYFFEGSLDVKISEKKRGKNGFGYDSILEYEGRTLAEMSAEEKNKISHRSIALEKLLNHLLN